MKKHKRKKKKQQMRPIKLRPVDHEVLSAAAKACGLTLHAYVGELAMSKAAELRAPVAA